MGTNSKGKAVNKGKYNNKNKQNNNNKTNGVNTNNKGNSSNDSRIVYTLPEYMQNISYNSVDNCYMLMHRFLIWDKDSNSNNNNSTGNGKNNNLKPLFFDDKFKKRISKISQAVDSVQANEQLKAAAESMGNSGVYDIECFDMKQTWNMVVGLGTNSVSETSMTLHHIYGIPYIPGQALKGIVRSYIIGEFFDNDEKKAMADELFASMFGRSDVKDEDDNKYEAKKGDVIFFDAYPVDKNVNCTMDIMNNHHTKYYNSEDIKMLNDTENPIPVKMLVINGAKFTFRIAVKKKLNIGDCKKVYFEDKLGDGEVVNNLLESVVRYAKQALKYCGVGAKTAVGYGLFEEVYSTRKGEK